jgi:hypothetical protein
MNFLKNVATAVGDAAEIGKLDKIVERRVNAFDRYVDECIKNLSVMHSEQEAAVMEMNIIGRCYNEYDSEACQFIGRPVNANWQEGGGDNLEVRKRMLKRQLEAKRGKLLEGIRAYNNTVRAQLNAYLTAIDQFGKQIREQLPCTQVVVGIKFDTFVQQLDAQIRPTCPDGFAGLNRTSNGALQTALTNVKVAIDQQNAILTAKFIGEYRRSMLQKFVGTLRQQIVQTNNQFKANELTAENRAPTDLITSSIVLDLHKQMDALMESSLSDLTDEKVLALLR